MATGFQPADYLARLRVVGRDGRTLQEHWAGEPRAYLGITVPGFPNFFMLYGPGTNGGEIVIMLESQAEYAVRAVKRMIRERVTADRGQAELRGAVVPLAPVQDGGHLLDDEQQLLQVTDREDRDPVAVRQPALPRADQAPGSRVGDSPPARSVNRRSLARPCASASTSRPVPAQPLERMIEQARALEQRGLELLWIGQLYEYEALALAALLGRETQRIALGTWVVPTYPRHPSVLAQQALTAQAASGNRLVLGIGLSHQVVIEKRLGLDFSRPVRHMREYLEVLLPLLRGEPVAHDGQLLPRAALRERPRRGGAARASRRTRTADAAAVAHASPTAWRSGWAAPTSSSASHSTHLREASAAAGRPFPRLAVGLPIAVCRDRAAARATAARWLAQSSALPSYQAVLARGGAAAPEDIAILGDEAEVRAQLARLAALGVSDFNAVCVPLPGRARLARAHPRAARRRRRRLSRAAQAGFRIARVPVSCVTRMVRWRIRQPSGVRTSRSRYSPKHSYCELRLGAAAHVVRADRARARRLVSGDLDPVDAEQVLGRAAAAEHALDELADLVAARAAVRRRSRRWHRA